MHQIFQIEVINGKLQKNDIIEKHAEILYQFLIEKGFTKEQIITILKK